MSCRIEVIVCLLSLVCTTSLSANNVDSLAGQMQYLTDYNYMGENSPSPLMQQLSKLYPAEAFAEALKLFQAKRGLNVTGEMNNETLEVMQRARCSVPDILENGDWWTPEEEEGGSQNSTHNETTHTRRKRYTLLGRKPEDYGWQKNKLTYSLRTILTDNTNLPESRQKEYIRKAFGLWQQYADFEVDEAFSYIIADIHLHFYKRYHGDISPFDGPSGKLAHAFSPSSGGNIHFDAEENWTIDDPNGKDFFQIAVHEVGHSLGLGHVDNSNSIMYPEYIYRNNYKLDQDDINGMQFLYGAREATITTTTTQKPTTTTVKTTSTTKPTVATITTAKTTKKPTTTTTTTTKTTTKKPTTTTTVAPSSNDICGSSLFHDIDFNTGEADRYYIFKGSQVAVGSDYYLSKMKVEAMAAIKNVFPNLPSASIDAVVTLPKLVQVHCTRWLIWYSCGEEVLVETARTYFFKGSEYFLYKENQFIWRGFISEKFPGVPNNLDAAFTTQGGKDIYFVKAGQVWRLARDEYTILTGYPKQLSFLVYGLPSDIKAATNNGVKNYFFTTSFVYRATYSTLSEMFTLDSSFTKKTSEWKDCSSLHGIEDDGRAYERPSNDTSSKTKRSASKDATVYVDQNGQIVDTEAANFRWNEEFEEWLEENVQNGAGASGLLTATIENVVVIVVGGMTVSLYQWFHL